LPRKNASHYLLLLAAKSGEAEQAVQYIGWRGGGSNGGHAEALARPHGQ